jgi:PAS domain S-box-containing protein
MDQITRPDVVPAIAQGRRPMEAAIHAHDWAASPLGAFETWPMALRTGVRTMLRSAVPAFVAWGARLTLLYNDAFVPILASRHPGALGRSCSDVWAEVWDDIRPLIDRALDGELICVENMPLRMARRGTSRDMWFTLSCVPLYDTEGVVAGLLCTCAETTQRMEAEHAMQRLNAALEQRLAEHVTTQRNEAFIAGVLAASPDCVKILSSDGRLEFMNERGVELNQLPSVDIVLGREFAALWPEDGRDAIRAAVARAAEGEITRIEGFCPTAKGEPRWWEASFAAFRPDADPLKLVSVSRDVTERVLAEQARRSAADALRELNATLERQVVERTAERNLLSRIVERTDTMVMAVALDYTILAINPANANEFERIYGVRPQVGDDMLELLADQPEHQAQVRAGWGRGLTGEELTFIEAYGDHQRARPHYEIRFRPLHDDQGILIGCYQFVSDVTQRLRDQTSLIEAQEALRQSQKMEAIGQLTGGIAHDFNNMLATITSSLELMSRRIASGKAGDLTRYLTMASTAAQSAAALIHRLLAFSRKQTLDLQAIEVNGLIAQMEDMLRRSTGENVRVAMALQPDLPLVCSDRNQLENALLNLTINARDAMPEGGTIRIATGLRELDASYAAMHPEVMPGPYVMVSVSDDGTGMPPEVVAKAFDPFFTTKPIGQGTGLGLSMIYGFARQTHGHASIHSIVDEGTTVNIYLPCNAASTGALVTREELVARSPQGQGETVLFVEDEPGVRLVLAEILGELGYVAHEAIDAPSAMAVARSLPRLDLLVSDVGLPGTNGRQLAEMMRAQRPGLKVLFITGYATNAAVKGEFLGRGMDMLAKPFTIDALARKVQAMLAAPAFDESPLAGITVPDSALGDLTA